MIPTIGLVLIGKARWTVPLPLPVFLAWPFILAGVASVTLAGLKVEVRSTEGTRVLVWLV